MNRKLRVMILTVVLTVLMFGGNRLLAESVENKPVESPQTAPTEENLEPKPNGDEGTPLETEENNAASSENTELAQDNNTDNSQEATADEEKNVPAQAQEATEEKTTEENANAQVENAQVEGQERAAQAAPAKAPAPDPQTPPAPAPNPQTPPAPAPADEDKGTPTKPVNPKNQIEKDKDEALKKKAEEIKAEPNPAKKEELKSEYNKLYLEAIAKSGNEKLNDAILDRFTDKYRTKEYYVIKEKYEALQKKAKDGKLTGEELDEFNKALGTFDPPRKLDADEQSIQDELNKALYVPSVKEDNNPVWTKFDAAKKALNDALDPEKARKTRAEDLAELKQAYDKAKKALDEAIKNKDITPKYTKDGKPEIYVYSLDYTGKPGKKLERDDKTYYIPDETNINLLVQVNRDGEDNKEFTFTIKSDEKGANISKDKFEGRNLVFLNGNPVDLIDNHDGTFTFTTTEDFKVAQLRFNIDGFRSAFHTGFTLNMTAGTITKEMNFLITKKGYEDEAHLNGQGSTSDKDPKTIPEVDAGTTQDSKVISDTAKVIDFFSELKKSKTYIDKIEFNSSSNESIPLSYVKITVKVPEPEGKKAEWIHKSKLKYVDNGNGTYTLELKTKDFPGNLTKGDNGELTLNGQKLTKANLVYKILESATGKVYYDGNGNKHDVKTEEYYESSDDTNSYKVVGNKLYIKAKAATDYPENPTVTFTNGEANANGKTYIFKNGKLEIYTDVHDVYEGNVANVKEKENGEEKEKGQIEVTPTITGKQVIIDYTEKDKNNNDVNRTSYGGTIIENGIFYKDGRYYYDAQSKKLTGQPGLQIIDAEGKKANVNYTGKEIKEYKENDKVLFKYVEVDGKIYHIVENAVFNENDYIVDGLMYKENLSLVDKYGKLMEDVKVEKTNETYTFKKIVKDKKTGKDKVDKTVTSGPDTTKNRTVTVEDNKQIYVDSNNYVKSDTETKDKYNPINGKYYFDGKKFVKVTDKDKVIDDKVFTGHSIIDLIKKVKETYKDASGKEHDITNKPTYKAEKDDLYQVGDKFYQKKKIGDYEYYESLDPNTNAEILSEFAFTKVVQVVKGVEKLTEEKSIFDAVQNARYGLRFPDFLAGKNIVYNVHADVQASYKRPKSNGEYEEVSIFSENDKTKRLDRFFTLKDKKEAKAEFSKTAPSELEKTPDYHFFNIFYRGADDRARDELITGLLNVQKTVDEAKKAMDNAADTDKEKLTRAYLKIAKENKAKTDLLAILQRELGRLYNAKFELTDNGFAIKDISSGKEKTIERSLLWEIKFTNEKGNEFPGGDNEIVIEDHNMDNRLVYDEIIVNDTEENCKKYKEEKEDFQEDKKYFYLNQIKDIRLGVNPNYIEGRFVPLGENYKITSEQIIKALGTNNTATITRGSITYTITRDTQKGQVRIKVYNAFYNKTNGSDSKFESPVQKEYQKKINDLINGVDSLKPANNSATGNNQANTVSDTTIKEFVNKLHADGTECVEIITKKLKEEIDKINNDTTLSPDQKTTKLNDFVGKLKTEVEKLKLKYLYEGDYKYNDMRFNAIRIALKPNLSIGGAMTPETEKKLGITSVIVPGIDIPYTDEFGKVLTNKDKYLYEEILKQNKAADWDKKEDSYRKVMEAAYNNIQNKNIIDLVEFDKNRKYENGEEKYTIKKGSDLNYDDLAINGETSIKNKYYHPVNPWYVGEGKAAKTIETLVKEKKTDFDFKSQEYKDKKGQDIDLAAYYMAKEGYNRREFKNSIDYKLTKDNQGQGIFGNDKDWKKKICYPPLGRCIEEAGNDGSTDTTDDADDSRELTHKSSSFTIDYEPTSKGPETENPKVKKDADKDHFDLSEKENGEAKEHKVDFTIDITVDKLKKNNKIMSDAELNKDDPDYKDEYYNKEGYYVYKNALIMDILPNILKFKDGETKTNLKVDKLALMKNGANIKFANPAKYKEFLDGIKYFYTDDLKTYLDSLSGEKKEVLEKAYNEAVKDGKIKEGQKVQAVLAWLPDFEAPHGSKNQFTFKLENVFIERKNYKEAADRLNMGQIYTNHAVFGDKAKLRYGHKDIIVEEGHKGKVNKYLQLLDEDGKVIDKETAEGWFKGNASIKFGQEFNYKIRVTRDSGIIKTSESGSSTIYTWNLEDSKFASNEKGLRPVLRDYAIVPKGFKALYKIDGVFKKANEVKKEDLAKVTAVQFETADEGFADKSTKEFILQMMIPELDAKIEGGKVKYIAKGSKDEKGELHEIGDAKDFFNLKDLVDKDKDLISENDVEGSNTVTIYLEKNRFIRLFKEFFDQYGKEIKKNRPEMRFDIYQYQTDEKGNQIGEKVKFKDKNGKGIQLVVNEENNFTDMVSNLPLFKKIIEVEKDGVDDKGNIVKGKTIETLTNYKYELKEVNSTGYKVEFEILDKGDDELGFVIKAKNTEVPPETPPGPNENPKNYKVRFSVNKVWKVLNGGATPSIQVELYANGKATGKVLTLGANGSWSASFEDLPAKDADGKDIVYTVREVGETKGITKIGEREFEVEYAGSIEEGFTIRNNEVPHEDPHEDPHEEPHEDPHEDPHDDNIIPKTGVSEDLSSIYFAFVLLLALVFIKRKYLAD